MNTKIKKYLLPFFIWALITIGIFSIPEWGVFDLRGIILVLIFLNWFVFLLKKQQFLKNFLLFLFSVGAVYAVMYYNQLF